MQGFLHCVWPMRIHFWPIFLLKNGHNSVENDRTRKKCTLDLKTIFKNVFLKYQVNTRFPSLCLASENDIFGGGRKPRRRRRKKKVSKPIGDRDAPTRKTVTFPGLCYTTENLKFFVYSMMLCRTWPQCKESDKDIWVFAFSKSHWDVTITVLLHYPCTCHKGSFTASLQALTWRKVILSPT